jgi:hypothetical protein
MLKLSSTLEHAGKNVAKMQTTNLYGDIFAMLKYITNHFSTIVYRAMQQASTFDSKATSLPIFPKCNVQSPPFCMCP